MRTAIISVKPSSLFITLSHLSAKPHQQFVKATFFIYREYHPER